MTRFNLGQTTEETISRLRWWARDHDATWSVARVKLSVTERMAVVVEDDDEQIAVVPFSNGCAVFRYDWDSARATWDKHYMGELEVKVADVDELYELLVCPRCHGEGEVPNSYTNEAGHRVNDPLPCPDCTPSPDTALPF